MGELLNKQSVYRESLVSYHTSSLPRCKPLHRNELIWERAKNGEATESDDGGDKRLQRKISHGFV